MDILQIIAKLADDDTIGHNDDDNIDDNDIRLPKPPEIIIVLSLHLHKYHLNIVQLQI